MAKRILLIEDEEKIARFTELELVHEGYEVGKAYDGRQGLEEALSGKYDLVLLDYMLQIKYHIYPLVLILHHISFVHKI